MSAFTYVVLRYVHDTAAGESLNFGVLLVAPEARFIDCRLDFSYGRLTPAFRGFDTNMHRRLLRDLQFQVNVWKKNIESGQLSMFPLIDAGAYIRSIWPDKGLNYQSSEARAGTAKDPEAELNALFDRFVTSQAPDRRPRARREDADVWKVVTKQLPAELAVKLLPSNVAAGPFSFKFEHTYQNGRLHVVEPLSFDLLEADSVRDKSLKWIGYSQHLKPYLGTLRLVVDGPDNDEVARAYRSALGILANATEVYEANQTDRLSHDLQKLMC